MRFSVLFSAALALFLQTLSPVQSGADYYLEANRNNQLADVFRSIIGKLGQQVHLAE